MQKTRISEPGHPGTIKRRGLMLVLSSPSGTGKTTISRKLLEQNSELELSISYTTRARRQGEAHGTHYYFVDQTEFNDMTNRGDFLEHAKVFNNYYGTPKKPVQQALGAGRDIMFDIDWQGTQQLAENARDDLVSIFLLPPSAREQERRLRQRAQDSDAEIARRLAKTKEEMGHWAEYDYVLINRDFDETLAAVQGILNSERLKRKRQIGLSDFVKGLKQGY